MGYLRTIACAAAVAAFALPAVANPFAGGWTLQAENSTLNFQSTKNETKVETSAFATFEGAIDDTGKATVTVELESVDTGIDLRNVRMRFLFFESFSFPKATITAQLDPASLADLPQKRRMVIALPFTLDLHGIAKSGEANVAVTLLTDDMVNVSTTAPITVAASDHDLMGGVQKLEEAASVKITPQAAVTFDFTFVRTGQAGVVEAEPTEEAAPTQTAALEPEGDFDTQACLGRFEILSRTDNITFRSGSARLTTASTPILDQLYDIVSRCPGMVVEVGGHTDNVGSDVANQRLSERRAASVVGYLENKGIASDTLVAKGYGEAEPAFDNDTADGRRRNRRIEFRVLTQ